MTTPPPPELAEKIQEIAAVHAERIEVSPRVIEDAIREAYPLIAAHVAKRAAEICRNRIEVPHGDGTATLQFRHYGNTQCADAIERELGGKDE